MPKEKGQGETAQWPKEKGHGETAQWPKEKGQRDKQRSTKMHIQLNTIIFTHFNFALNFHFFFK
jgi:ABC-type phosphate transport system substrate-binding protein